MIVTTQRVRGEGKVQFIDFKASAHFYNRATLQWIYMDVFTRPYKSISCTLPPPELTG